MTINDLLTHQDLDQHVKKIIDHLSKKSDDYDKSNLEAMHDVIKKILVERIYFCEQMDGDSRLVRALLTPEVLCLTVETIYDLAWGHVAFDETKVNELFKI